MLVNRLTLSFSLSRAFSPISRKETPDSLQETPNGVLQHLSVPEFKPFGGNQAAPVSQLQQITVPPLNPTPSFAYQSSSGTATAAPAAAGSRTGNRSSALFPPPSPSPSPSYLDDVMVAQLLGLGEPLPASNAATSFAPLRDPLSYSGSRAAKTSMALPRSASFARGAAALPPFNQLAAVAAPAGASAGGGSGGSGFSGGATTATAGGAGAPPLLRPSPARLLAAPPPFKSLRPDMFLDQMAASPCATMFGEGPAAAADISAGAMRASHQVPADVSTGAPPSSFHVVPSLPHMPSPMGGGAMRWGRGSF